MVVDELSLISIVISTKKFEWSGNGMEKRCWAQKWRWGGHKTVRRETVRPGRGPLLEPSRGHQERRLGARADGGGGGRDGGVRGGVRSGVRGPFAPVERHDVHQRGVRAGHQRDQRYEHDRRVLGHGPAGHPLAPATAAPPPPPLLPLRAAVSQVGVVVHRVVVARVKVALVLGVGVAAGFAAVLVAVFPERGQVDDRGTHEPEDGEEHGSDQRDERRQVGHESGYEHCETTTSLQLLLCRLLQH